jgi:DNA-3-methyladenine glycosylase
MRSPERPEALLSDDAGLIARLRESPALPPTFFARPSLDVAPDLLGTILVHDVAAGLVTAGLVTAGLVTAALVTPGGAAAAADPGQVGFVAGRIVEVEAYDGPEDRASHARAGRTERTAPMFGPPGHAYVYLVYGLHHCLNVVTGASDQAGAVLLRAVAPVAGIELMRTRRGSPHEPDERLAAGPGRLGAAFAIERGLSGADLTAGALRLLPATALQTASDRAAIVAGPRVGVAYAGEPWASLPWRFRLEGDPSVSR